MHTIYTQSELSPRSTVLACAEGLLGELIKYARMGFNDMMTELPLHATVQLIAAVRGYHHHHEYPVFRTRDKGDHKRLDFVFSRVEREYVAGDETNMSLIDLFPVEMKVFAKSSKNYGKPWNEAKCKETNIRKCHDVDEDLRKIKVFCDDAKSEHGIETMTGYLLVVNMDIDSGIRWDVEKAGGVRPHNVHLLQRYYYSYGNIKKSVTVYEVTPDSKMM